MTERLPAWPSLPLGEIARDMCLGKMLDKQKNKGELRPYLRNVNVRWFSFDLSDLKEMRFADGEGIKYGLEPGDLVICEGGEPGRAAVWRGGSDVIRIQKALHRVRFSPDQYDPAFALCYLYCGTRTDRFVRHYTGSTIRHLTGRALAQVKFPVAPLVEQRAIVAKIEALFSELDKGVEQLEQVAEQLKRYRQAVLKAAFEGKLTAEWRAQQQAAGTLPSAEDLLEQIQAERTARYAQQLADWKQAVEDWEAAGGKSSGQKKPRKPAKPKDLPPLSTKELTDLPNLPDGWRWMRVGTLLAEISDGPFGSNLKSSDYVPSGVLVIRLENIGEQEFLADKESFVSERKYGLLRKHTVSEGDIIFSSFLGEFVRACVLPASIDRAVNKADCFCLRPLQGVDRVYLCRGFALRAFYHAVAKHVHGATRPRVNTTQLQEAPIPHCSAEEQQLVVSEIEARFSVLDELEKAVAAGLKQAEALRQSILKKAFEGRLLSEAEMAAVRTNPDYEPAEVLLERIRAEREQAGTSTKRGRKAKTAPLPKVSGPERYKQAAYAAYAVQRLAGRETFGRVQQMKLVYLIPHALAQESKVYARREAAGPLDPAIHKIEGLAKKNRWFTTRKVGQRYKYTPGAKIDEAVEFAKEKFGDKTDRVDWLLGQFAKMDTEQAELVATTFAVWNDHLIDGHEPSGDEIVAGVHGWHPEKVAKFPPDRIARCIQWMKDNSFVPTGIGPKTT